MQYVILLVSLILLVFVIIERKKLNGRAWFWCVIGFLSSVVILIIYEVAHL